METLTDLEKGIEILEPFLKRHNFVLNPRDNSSSPDNYFILTKFKNENKEIILGYQSSIGQIVYKFDNFKVSHDFYLDKLGFAGKRKFKEVQTEDKLLIFKNILYDFEFLVEDFFDGECTRLKEYSRLPENIINQYEKRAKRPRIVPDHQSDEIRIIQARKEFLNKAFKESLKTFMAIENKKLISSLDEKIMDYCKSHIGQLKKKSTGNSIINKKEN